MVSSHLLGVKVFWGLVILVAWGCVFCFGYQVSDEVFNKKKVFQTSRDIPVEFSTLPDITICAANPFQGYLADEKRRLKSK